MKTLKDVIDDALRKRRREIKREEDQRKRRMAEEHRLLETKQQKEVEEAMMALPNAVSRAIEDDRDYITVLYLDYACYTSNGQRKIEESRPYKSFWEYLKEQGLTPCLRKHSIRSIEFQDTCIDIKLPKA